MVLDIRSEFVRCCAGSGDSMNKMRNLLVGFAGMMLAFTAQPSNASDFCSEPGAELVQQLAGRWRVSHGPGAAFAAGMSIPYPAPRDAIIDFEYMPDIGVIFATGVDQVGEMLIVPSPSSVEEMVSAAIGASQDNGGSDSCDGSAMPVMVGTSNYPNFEQVEGDFGPTACETMYRTMYVLALFGGLRELGGVVNYMSDNNTCDSVENTLVSGGMVMKMVVHFSDASNGSGYLTFEGHANGRSFQAYTPVTLSRS